jgi:acyl-CoA synthetase (AMP-forming)/AMP-acid ligase II
MGPHDVQMGEPIRLAASERAANLVDMVERTDTALAALRDAWSALGRDAVATIVHTSGTSGEPKGVVLTHGNVIHNYEAVRQALPFDEHDLALSVLPLSHMLERAAGVYVPLAIGAGVAFAEPVMERWAANLVEVRPTIMVTIPRRSSGSSAGAPGSGRAATPTTWPAVATRRGYGSNSPSRARWSWRGSRPAPAAGCATSAPAVRRCRAKWASSSTPWACSSSRAMA